MENNRKYRRNSAERNRAKSAERDLLAENRSLQRALRDAKATIAIQNGFIADMQKDVEFYRKLSASSVRFACNMSDAVTETIRQMMQQQ